MAQDGTLSFHPGSAWFLSTVCFFIILNSSHEHVFGPAEDPARGADANDKMFWEIPFRFLEQV
jgi:hypothetical protein